MTSSPVSRHSASKKRIPLEPLDSNIVNYLVWRYLQEAGFAAAAERMGKAWHRDPHLKMPFAPYIKRAELVHMLQDALFLDDVRSKGIRSNRLYYFGDDTGPRCSAPVLDIVIDERLPLPSSPYKEMLPPKHRQLSHTSQTGQTGQASQTSQANQVDQTEQIDQVDQADQTNHVNLGNEANQVNQADCDAMELDEEYGQSDQMSEPESLNNTLDVPLLGSLTITVDRAITTEKPKDLMATTNFLSWPRKAYINKAVWSSYEAGPLLVGGVNTLRIFDISKPDSVFHKDIYVGLEKFEVEALCWIGEGSAVAAVSSRTFASTEQDNRSLIHITDWDSHPAATIAPLCGVIFTLKYQLKSRLLLSVSGGCTSTLSVYHVGGRDNVSAIASRDVLNLTMFDAAWMSSTKFITCGTNSIQIYKVNQNSLSLDLLQSHDMQRKWFKIQYDPISSIALFSSEDMKLLRQYNAETEDTKTLAFDVPICDFELQPLPFSSTLNSLPIPISLPSSPTTQTSPCPSTFAPAVRSPAPIDHRILATSTQDGTIQLWDILRPFTCLRRFSLASCQYEGPVISLSWNPTARYWLPPASTL